MKLLLDEMYPDKLAQALRDQGVDAVTVAESGLADRSDADVFAVAGDGGHVLLKELGLGRGGEDLHEMAVGVAEMRAAAAVASVTSAC